VREGGRGHGACGTVVGIAEGIKSHQLTGETAMYQREISGVAYVTVTPFARIVGRQVQSWKLGAWMFTAFGIIALAPAAIGLYSVIAYAVAPWVGPLLFDVSPRDPAVYGVVAVALLVVSMVATWLPARWASRVDPVRALPCE